MKADTLDYRAETLADHTDIEALHAEAFGPGRFARAAFRLREGVPHDPALSFIATSEQILVASVRLTPITIGGRSVLLLGPLAVKPAFKGQGAGRALVRMAVAAAREAGHRVILLVGDLPYYAPLGFQALPRRAVILPSPVDPDRVLAAELVPGALEGLSGPARRIAPEPQGSSD
ncbi:GNAT family N-acetyltransferase [Bauldia sp.]|uniref:GNAT family N-acetyltransferase n=1 Tax=Bauldia sp. TaxID=2575872 RepID=UPI003BAD98BD